jgi:hypothetical protein
MRLHAATRHVAPPSRLKAAVAFYGRTELRLPALAVTRLRRMAENISARDPGEGIAPSLDSAAPLIAGL